ncbi:sigma-54-dependent Fis family transcriptional regulator [Ectothiorhodospiraceae bacterium WFHF3C12]|nr:sigma-54-dependent Fis family transcriptional regulator [Ectothiorhodospiraceae bacterium WFHF3C12]
MSAPYVLVVDDEPDIRTLVEEILEDEGYEVDVAENAAAARLARRRRRPDLILLDIWMPDVDGVTLLKEWTEEGGPACPVVMISGHGTVETAVEATRLGAYDFIEKPLSLAKLLLTVERALERDRLQRENAGLRQNAGDTVEPVGKSATMRELREQVQRLAAHSSWVLFTGEAGSGKKCLAHYLHDRSARAAGPFIEMAAGTLSGQRAARKLFGSEEDGRIVYGLLEQANHGTLFIDELADLDLEAQARLLSALHGSRIYRMAGTEPVALDVRIVAASRVDLENEVRLGRFREDLYYHLNVVPLQVPPLREHAEDVPDLLNYYLDRLVDQENLAYRRFTLAAQNRLRNYDWPGNVRELKNLVQRLLILGDGSDIDLEEVESALAHRPVAASPPQPVPEPGGDHSVLPLDLPLREAREQFERIYLQHQLRRAEGSVGQLAKLTGMERTNLYRKLKALGIDPKESA